MSLFNYESSFKSRSLNEYSNTLGWLFRTAVVVGFIFPLPRHVLFNWASPRKEYKLVIYHGSTSCCADATISLSAAGRLPSVATHAFHCCAMHTLLTLFNRITTPTTGTDLLAEHLPGCQCGDKRCRAVLGTLAFVSAAKNGLPEGPGTLP